MKVRKIDHIGIAVNSIEESKGLYEQALGLKLSAIEEIPERHVRVAFFDCGETEIELVEPLSQDSAVAGYIQKYGEGFYHMALEIENMDQSVAHLASMGLHIRGSVPSAGARGSKIAFLNREDTRGVMLELVEKGETK